MKALITLIITLIGLLPTFAWGAVRTDSVQWAVGSMMAEFPESTLLDIYKSAFQNRYGPGHIVADTTRAKNYLDWELQQPFKHRNPLYEPTIPDAQFVRVNLAVINEGIVPYQVFFDAFLDSMHDIDMPPVSQWAVDWAEILDVVESMNLNLPNFDEDREAIRGRLAQGIYQGEHSSEYGEAYDPHYRIIRADIFYERLKPLIDKYINSPKQ